MIDLDIQSNSKDVGLFIRSLPDESLVSAKAILHRRLFEAKTTIQKNATSVLKVRTGTLKRSIHSAVKGTSINTLSASLYAAGMQSGQVIKYAPIHEYGGTIRAKNAYRRVPGGPYLNIPSQANKTPAGVMRMDARSVFNQGGHIQGRAVYLNGVAMFYLVKSVNIRPRLGMREAVEDIVPTLLSDLAAEIGK